MEFVELALNYYGKGEFRKSVWTIPIFFKRSGSLIAHTTEKHLEVGVPVCYLNEQGDVVIKPQFKFAFPFEGNRAKVTLTGEQKAIPDGEHHEWVSDKWQHINKKGELIQ